PHYTHILLMPPPPLIPTLFPYTTLFRSASWLCFLQVGDLCHPFDRLLDDRDRPPQRALELRQRHEIVPRRLHFVHFRLLRGHPRVRYVELRGHPVGVAHPGEVLRPERLPHRLPPRREQRSRPLDLSSRLSDLELDLPPQPVALGLRPEQHRARLLDRSRGLEAEEDRERQPHFAIPPAQEAGTERRYVGRE